MTGNEFNAEYKLGQRIASGTVESYLAHVIATRRLVMVHRLTGASDVERRRINSLVDALPSRACTSSAMPSESSSAGTWRLKTPAGVLPNGPEPTVRAIAHQR